MPPPPFYKFGWFVVFFFFLNKLVLTSISQCSDACLVFGSRLFSADEGEAVYARTPGGTAAQEGTGHGRAMVPLSFLPCSILGGGGRAAKRKTDPKYSAYGLHVDMGSLRISCGPCRCSLEA